MRSVCVCAQRSYSAAKVHISACYSDVVQLQSAMTVCPLSNMNSNSVQRLSSSPISIVYD